MHVLQVGVVQAVHWPFKGDCPAGQLERHTGFAVVEVELKYGAEDDGHQVFAIQLV